MSLLRAFLAGLEAVDMATTGAERHREQHCACGWSGTKPTFSDASIERLNFETMVVEHDRRHVALCPACFCPLGIEPS